MNNLLGNNTKAKLLFIILAILLTLITWYKLRVQGITLIGVSETKYETVLVCKNTEEEHIHTKECYERVLVENNEKDEQQEKEQQKNQKEQQEKEKEQQNNQKEQQESKKEQQEKEQQEKEQQKNEKDKQDDKKKQQESEKVKKENQKDKKDGQEKAENNDELSILKEQSTNSEDFIKNAEETSEMKTTENTESIVEEKQGEISTESIKEEQHEEILTESEPKNEEDKASDLQTLPTVLKYENDEVTVIATATQEGVFPIGSELNVSEIKKEDEKYSEIEKELSSKAEESEKYESLAGFIAYDITLKDSNGNEIEPNGNVKISLDYKSAMLPLNENDEKQDLNILVHHFKENDNGKVVDVVNLAENNQLQNVEVNDNLEIKKVEFETDSFSTFTITYYNGTTYYSTVNVHYVDEIGNEINVQNAPSDNNIRLRYTTTTSTISLSDYIRTANGYVYKDAHYGSYNGKAITEIQAKREKNTPTSINTNTVNCTVTFLNNSEVVGLLEYENSTRAIDIYLVYANTNGITISDTIAIDGCLNALTEGNLIEASSTVKYKWYRSTDGTNYNEVRRIKITGDQYNITSENGPSINIALDEGANKYYKVERYIVNSDGTETLAGSATYLVPYYSDVQNGSFENPRVSTGSTLQTPNNTAGIIWKTTGPGTGSHAGADIEIVNASDVNGNGANDLTGTIRSYNFAYVPDGNQCAELNCEAAGALYQDVLTIPGSQLYWSLYHRARGPYRGSSGGIKYDDSSTDTMYVVAMSKEEAEKYDVTTQAKVEAILEKVQNQEEGFEDIEIVKLTTTNNGKGKMTFTNGTVIEVDGTPFGTGGSNYGSSAWHYYSGHFSIPEGQYLTRFFFVAGPTASNNNTVGNLLDDIVVSTELPAPNKGQATIRIKKVVANLEELPSNYSVPIQVDFVSDNTAVSRTRNYDSYSLVYDENDQFTGKRSQWHDYTVTIPANGTGKLNYAKELDSNLYLVDGYKTNTSIVVTKKPLNGTVTTLFNGEVKEFTESQLSNSTINEGDFIQVEITNTYEHDVADVIVNKADMDGNLINGGAVFNICLKTDNTISQTIGDLSEPTEEYENVDGIEDGKLQFSNLRYSTHDESPEYVYVLTEVKAPSGYYKFEKTIEFYVKKENEKAVVILRDEQDISEYVSANENEITVKDMPYVTMPEAGGEGIYFNYIVGIVLIFGVAVAYGFLNKK